VVLDGELVREAFRLTGARTKRELIDMALRELVRVRRKKDLMELAGQIRLRKDFDHKGLRALRHGSR
jgi:Arc/MetJ family transcription regulator